jgi:tetratricopeptide (TPR) repeat protein
MAKQSVPAAQRPGRNLSDLYLFAGLLCATFAAYWPALGGGMLWDDDRHVTAPDLQSLHGLWRIWFDPGATQQYYPLLHSAFWMEHRLWGDAVPGYHLVNVLLHAVAALLVVMLARRLSLAGAWLAGFVFALHPVCVEAVAWISEQKSVLSAVFYLGAALAYLQFDRSRRKRDYALATGLFVLALLTKTVTATLPAALLVVLWWQRGRLEWRRDGHPLLPWFAVAIPAGLVTAWVERTSIGARGPEFALSFAQRCLLAPRALWFYFGKIVWPANLMFTYPHWTLDTRAAAQYLYPAGILAIAAVLAVAAWRGWRGPTAAFLIFAGTLFPVLGFLNVYPFRFSYVADHFQYLACIALIVPLAAYMQPRKGKAVVLLLPALLGILTFRQSAMYRDAETLYRETLARNPESWMAETNLCSLLLEKPAGLEEAVQHCQSALRLKPDYAEAHNDLGVALARMPGRIADAIAHFEAAVASKPDFAEAHFNLANALVLEPGGMLEAAAEYRAAIHIRPDYLQARMNLGAVLSRIPGKLPEAIDEYQAALAIDPNLAEAYNNLGSALAQLPGRGDEALRAYQNAVRLKPGYAKAHNNLGTLLADTPGRLTDAIAEYQAAVRANPNYTEARYNLGLALARAGRNAEAVEQLQQTLLLEPGSARARHNLDVLQSQTLTPPSAPR